MAAAAKAKKPEYALMYPPHNDRVGNYNHSSESTAFFKDEGEWDTPEGEFFLKWYSDGLIKHGDRLLTRARRAFKNTGIHLAAKVAGIHWHYNSSSHAPELTAGYYNTMKRNGYKDIATMFASHKALFDFTCLEMRNRELPDWAFSRPQELVEQTLRAAHQSKALYAGENALPRFDRVAYEQMLAQCCRAAMKADGTVAQGAGKGTSIAGFTYLRLCPQLLEKERNWLEFMRFAQEMRSGFKLNRWGAPPHLKQSRRSNITDHHAIEVDDEVHELMVQLGGVPLYPASTGPGADMSRVPKPASIVSGNNKFFSVPRVMSGIQAGERAGRNGRSVVPARTIRFRIVENPTEEELRQHEASTAKADGAGAGGSGGQAPAATLNADARFNI